jgi:hypothetical protein
MSPYSASSTTRGATYKLRITHGRSYLVSRYGPVFAAQTFWM